MLVSRTFEAFESSNDSRFPSSNWNLEDGYSPREASTYPYRASGSGKNSGLKFVVRHKVLERKSGYNKGFKLAFHLPCEIPRFDKQFYRIPLNRSITLNISPSVIVTEGLKNYNIKTRQCFFKEEKKLKLFKMYTRSNCELECIAETTKTNCSCTPFYVPQMKDDKVCDTKELMDCVDEVKRNLTQMNMVESLATASNSYDDSGGVMCGCLPPCTNLHYNVEMSFADMPFDENKAESE